LTSIEQKIIEELNAKGFQGDLEGLVIEESDNLIFRRLLIKVKWGILGSKREELEHVARKIAKREGISLVRILPEMV
jgi:RNA-binding protein YhbY